MELFNTLSANPQSESSFVIESQMLITGHGLHPQDVITFFAVRTVTPARPPACSPCELPPVVFPEINSRLPLLCGDCQGTTVKLTAANPIITLDSPQGVEIIAMYSGPGLGFSVVSATPVKSQRELNTGSRGCCPYKATFLLNSVCDSACGETGYAFRDGDYKDPAATVPITACDGTVTAWIYPTKGPGHSVPYYDTTTSTTPTGYMVNVSTGC